MSGLPIAIRELADSTLLVQTCAGEGDGGAGAEGDGHLAICRGNAILQIKDDHIGIAGGSFLDLAVRIAGSTKIRPPHPVLFAGYFSRHHEILTGYCFWRLVNYLQRNFEGPPERGRVDRRIRLGLRVRLRVGFQLSRLVVIVLLLVIVLEFLSAPPRHSCRPTPTTPAPIS